MALDQLGAGDQRGDLLLLLDLPVDEGLDVGMVDVDDHHLGGAARRAARLDRAGGAVADLEEAHQAGRAAAAGELLVLAAQAGEIGAGAGAVFEQARLAHPQIHDAALVDEVVGDRLDEAGVRLRVLVGRLGLGQLAARVVDVIMALPRPVDAVGPVQAGVEPLRRVGRGHLSRQHEARLVEIGLGVGLRVEIAALPAPIGPGAGEPVEHLLGRGLRAVALGLGQRLQSFRIGNRPPQKRRRAVLFHALQARGHAGLAEILLRQHVGGDLAPAGRHFEPVEREHHRAVGVADLALGRLERDRRVGRLRRLRVPPLDMHGLKPRCSAGARPPSTARAAPQWQCQTFLRAPTPTRFRSSAPQAPRPVADALSRGRPPLARPPWSRKAAARRERPNITTL